MAYSAANLSVGFQLIGGAYRLWVYKSADPIGDVDATDYFALAGYGLAGSPGMREGDAVLVVETDTDPPTWALCNVTAIDADYNVTVAVVAFAGAASFTTLDVSGNANIGDAVADTLGFHGATAVTQRAGSNQASSNVVTSASFGTLQVAQINEIQNALTQLGLWKGSV